MGQRVLEEVNLLKQFLKSLGLNKAKKVPVKASKSEATFEITDFVDKVLKSLHIKHGRGQVQSNSESAAVKYSLTMGGKKYILKAYLVLESGQFNLILWSADQQELIDAIAVGKIRDKYRLRAIAKQRLARWTNDERS